MGVSKVIYGNQTLIDLTQDTVAANKLLSGYTAHGADGEAISGSCTYDADTSDGTATASDILTGSSAYVAGSKVDGSMPNRGAVAGTISSVASGGAYIIQNGYHDGSGTVDIDATEKAKIIAENIKEGVSILGVTGTCSPASGVTAQAKTVTPYTTQQVVTPDSGYDYLSQVTVNAIYYNESQAAQGGGTVVTIGTVAPSA